MKKKPSSGLIFEDDILTRHGGLVSLVMENRVVKEEGSSLHGSCAHEELGFNPWQSGYFDLFKAFAHLNNHI